MHWGNACTEMPVIETRKRLTKEKKNKRRGKREELQGAKDGVAQEGGPNGRSGTSEKEHPTQGLGAIGVASKRTPRCDRKLEKLRGSEN